MKVRINAQHTVRYSRVVDIPDEKFALYKEMCERDAPDSEFEGEYGGYLDLLNDVLDADELEEIELTKVSA